MPDVILRLADASVLTGWIIIAVAVLVGVGAVVGAVVRYYVRKG